MLRLYTVREIWWCRLGVNAGTEQDGRGQWYVRDACLVVPLPQPRVDIRFVYRDRRSCARFSLTALDTKFLLDIFYATEKVLKFKLGFSPETRDILTQVSKILPCFGLKGYDFLVECRELFLRYHTIKSGIEFLLRHHPLYDNAQDFSNVLKLSVLFFSFLNH
jgi:hypothetical protein